MISDYGEYVSRLRELLVAVADDGLICHRNAVEAALDGQAAEELKNLVQLPVRRSRGAFFTGSELRRRAVSGSRDRDGVVYFDPACGAGDLLVEAALRMPSRGSFEGTVRAWGERLLGCDVEPDFVETAKLRLLLAAAYRSRQRVPRQIRVGVFPGLFVGDGRSQPQFAKKSDHILINPPFGYVKAPDATAWASGRVSEAAVFLENVLEYVPVDMMVTAILPDVLRSGTRYRKWRSMVESLVEVSAVEIHGVFDETTDIDVFVLRGTRSDLVKHSKVRWVPQHRGTSVGDFFKIHVGAVVPHRDPESGPSYPFIWSRRLPSSGSFDPGGESRQFTGRTFSPPFVAIRRTSRPGQRRRVSGVLIVGDRSVAVENHLLVALPRDGTESSCLDLIDVLEDQRTKDWLDQLIRTRHLTVSAVRDLPWLGNDADG